MFHLFIFKIRNYDDIFIKITFFLYRRAKDEERYWDWKHRSDLIHPSDPHRIIYVQANTSSATNKPRRQSSQQLHPQQMHSMQMQNLQQQ